MLLVARIYVSGSVRNQLRITDLHCTAQKHANFLLAAFEHCSIMTALSDGAMLCLLPVHVLLTIFTVDAIREQRIPLSQPGVPYLLHLPDSCPLTVSQGVQSVIQVCATDFVADLESSR
jgi:hypothetical protein